MRRDDSTDPPPSGKEWQVRIPVSVMMEAIRSLSDRAFVTLQVIESHARNADVCYPSKARLAEMMEVSPRTVQASIAELAEKGYIRRETEHSGRSVIRLMKRITLRSQPLEYEDIGMDGGEESCRGGEKNPAPRSITKMNKGDESGNQNYRRGKSRREIGRTLPELAAAMRAIPHAEI